MTPAIRCPICDRPWSEMKPIGSADGLDYRHCPCGDTLSAPSPVVVPSRGAGEVLAQLLPRRLSRWQWGVWQHPLTRDVWPVMVHHGGLQFLADN